MVWAGACEVGCAIVECPSLSDLYYYHYIYNPFSEEEYPETAYLMVCVYGPGYPTEIYNNRPYTPGEPCSECPDQYSECDDDHYQRSQPQYYNDIIWPVTGAGLGIDDTQPGGLCCK